MRKILLCALFFISFFGFGEEDLFFSFAEDGVRIEGNLGKALSVSFIDFETYDYPIERYTIVMREDNEFYIIYFIPKIDDYLTANYGAQEFGNSIIYRVSKESLEIVKRTFGR